MTRETDETAFHGWRVGQMRTVAIAAAAKDWHSVCAAHSAAPSPEASARMKAAAEAFDKAVRIGLPERE